MDYTIAAFYSFQPVAHPALLREAICRAFTPDDLCGTLLIAPEGVNGTLAGSPAILDQLIASLALDRASVRFSHAAAKPFRKLKIRCKREIITFGEATADPACIGARVEASDWNALIGSPDVLVLDTRNRYETELGSFAGAVDPAIDTFKQFAGFVRRSLDPTVHRKVAMYCTGGIRCEKASAFMRVQGFAEVYQLNGGILKYLEAIPPERSLWRGGCFVFDERVAVGHGLRPTRS